MNNYHVVYNFSVAREDWMIDGIYSKACDAEQRLADLKASGSEACAVVQLSHEELVHRLTEERIGAIAAAIKDIVP